MSRGSCDSTLLAFQDISRGLSELKGGEEVRPRVFGVNVSDSGAMKWRNGCWDWEVQLISPPASFLSVTLITDTCWALPFVTSSFTPIPPSVYTYQGMTPFLHKDTLTGSSFGKHTAWPFCCNPYVAVYLFDSHQERCHDFLDWSGYYIYFTKGWRTYKKKKKNARTTFYLFTILPPTFLAEQFSVFFNEMVGCMIQ